MVFSVALRACWLRAWGTIWKIVLRGLTDAYVAADAAGDDDVAVALHVDLGSGRLLRLLNHKWSVRTMAQIISWQPGSRKRLLDFPATGCSRASGQRTARHTN